MHKKYGLKYKIIPRVDDGTFDLFSKDERGKLDFLGNFDTSKEAKDEISNMQSPMSQGDALEFMRSMKQSLNTI